MRLDLPVEPRFKFQNWIRVFAGLQAYLAFTFLVRAHDVLQVWERPRAVLILVANVGILLSAFTFLIRTRSTWPFVVLLISRWALYSVEPGFQSPEASITNWTCLGLTVVLFAPRFEWRHFRFALFVTISAGYLYSAILKLATPTWIDGSAVPSMLVGMYGGDLGRSMAAAWSSALMSALAWLAIAAQLTMGLGYFQRRLFLGSQLSLILMHLFILFGTTLTTVSFGMLMLHALLWVQPPRFDSVGKARLSLDNFT